MGAATQQQDDAPITDINVAPLVDVSLVLVIIFMAIAPLAIQAGIKVLESKATASVGKVSADDNVRVRLAKDGRVTVNETAADALELLPLIVAALDRSQDKMVILTADDENKVGEVVSILDYAKQAGARKLAIMRGDSASAAPKENG